jgi:hypothetical protein
VRSGDDPFTGKEEGYVNEVRHGLGQLFNEEGSKGLTRRRRIEWRGCGGTVHDRWGKAKMRPARRDSGDEVGRGSTGELAHFH